MCTWDVDIIKDFSRPVVVSEADGVTIVAAVDIFDDV